MEVSAAKPRFVGRVRRVAFYLLAVLFGLLLLHPEFSLTPYVVLGWFLTAPEGGVSHRVHDISFGLIFALSFVGLVSQFRSAAQKVAPMQQVVIAIVILILVELLVNGWDPSFLPLYVMFGLPPIILALLHPARAEVFRPSVRSSTVLLAMVALVAAPLLWFAAGQIRTAAEAAAIGRPIFEQLEGTISEDASEEEWEAAFRAALAEAGLSPETQVAVEHAGHWTAMAAFAVIVIAVGLVAALRVRGWRLTAWSVGAAVAYYGLASVLTPADASSGGAMWGGLAMVWGVLFVILAERELRADRRRPAEAPLEP
ncbi:MAG: hypothetical protein M3N51_11315 [Actinomycetota bacterium]|nr:hypothetical protein [Actinomycetota bacterium]